MKLIITISLALIATLATSCNPLTYTVNTQPYVDQIQSNPGAVIIKKEDVTPNGGLQFQVAGEVVTDYGSVISDHDGITVAPVVDLRSGK